MNPQGDQIITFPAGKFITFAARRNHHSKLKTSFVRLRNSFFMKHELHLWRMKQIHKLFAFLFRLGVLK